MQRCVDCLLSDLLIVMRPLHIVLDIDGWDDPTYGKQEKSAFHGYYGQHMYFPVLINEANSGFPLVMQLRSPCR